MNLSGIDVCGPVWGEPVECGPDLRTCLTCLVGIRLEFDGPGAWSATCQFWTDADLISGCKPESNANLIGAAKSGAIGNVTFLSFDQTGSCCTTNSASALGPKVAPAMIVNQQPMIALPMLMVTEPLGSPMSWSSSTIGACVRKHNILLSAEISTASPFAYDLVSFVPACIVCWTIGGLLGETVVASYTRRAFRLADGVGAPAA